MNKVFPWKAVYVGSGQFPIDYVDQESMNPIIANLWEQIVIDEVATKSCMIFRKLENGDITMETILRSSNGVITSIVAEQLIPQEYVWEVVEVCSENKCELFLTVNAAKFMKNRNFD